MTMSMDFSTAFTVSGSPSHFADPNNEADDLKHPFLELGYDPNSQTGADWYRVMLAASMGGVEVHGINVTPCVETLAKTDEEFALKHVHGRLKLHDNCKLVPNTWDEDDLCNQPYAGRPYHGYVSSSMIEMAFDEDEWAPAARSRSKNAVTLAATMYAQTGDMDNALGFASYASYSEITAELVECVVLPEQIGKRDVILTNKPSHNVYSTGAIQRAIIWEDQNLGNELIHKHIAIDWARVTAIARYIAEANSKYDPNFRTYAKERGVPYVLISGAWATVSSEDYRIKVPEEVFDLKGILSDLGIKPIDTAITEHTDSMLVAMNRSLAKLSGEGMSASASELLKLIEGVKLKRSNIHKKKTMATHTPTLVGKTVHSIDTGMASQIVRDSSTSMDHLKDAAYALYHGDRDLMKKLSVVLTSGSNQVQKLVSDIAGALISKAVFTRAYMSLARSLGNDATALDRMTRLYRITHSFSGSLNADPPLNVTPKEPAVFTMNVLAKHVLYGKAPAIIDRAVIPTMRAATGVTAVKNVLNYAKTTLENARSHWGDRYEAKSKVIRSGQGKDWKFLSIAYAAASSHMRAITAADLLSPSTYYIDMANIGNSYLLKSANNFARKRRQKPLVPTNKLDITEVVKSLDDYYKPDVTFKAVVEFVASKVEPLAQDIVHALQPDISDDESGVDELMEDTLDTARVASNSSAKSSFTLGFSFNTPTAPFKPSYESVLRTYCNLEEANEHAVINGFDDFGAAYEALGEKARMDEESAYSAKAIKQLVADKKAKEEANADYETII